MYKKAILFPHRLCETLSGDLAYTVGRLAFRPGRPMLVEHVGGVYLEHDLSGSVLTAGYGEGYAIAHVYKEEEPHHPPEIKTGTRGVPRRTFA